METPKAARARRIKAEVPKQKASDEIEEALKGIKWQIGDPDQIRIRDMYNKIIRLRTYLARAVVRKKALARATMQETQRQKEVKMKEASLLWTIEEVKKKQS